MSNRYNLDLINTKTGQKFYHQLFGNNEWFTYFEKYLTSIGADVGDEWMNETKIPNIEELIKAIDETVWYDIILLHPIRKSETPYDYKTRLHSDVLDFTPNLIQHYHESNTIERCSAIAPIYTIAHSIATDAYFFSSYSLVNWLEKCGAINAIEESKIKFTKHTYVEPLSDKGELIILGNWNPDFELYISYN